MNHYFFKIIMQKRAVSTVIFQNKKNILGIALIAISFACASTQKQIPSGGENVAPLKKAGKTRLLWISLDGLKKDDLVQYASALADAHPKGLRYLLSRSNWNDSFAVSNPTITASSHISTISCSAPGQHGVYANGQWNGSKMESGFSTLYEQETFPITLRNAGLKIASLGYPSLDARTVLRSPSLGFTYDESPEKSFVINVNIGEKKSLKIKNRATNGFFDFNLAYEKDTKNLVLINSNNQSLDLKPEKWIELIFETPKGKELVIARPVSINSEKAGIYFSSPMMNDAFPEEYKKELDKRNFIFSPGKDYSLKKFGDSVFFAAMEHRLNYFESVAKYTLKAEKPDAMFLYFEDLDVLGHQFANSISSKELRNKYAALIDKSIGAVLEELPADANVVILGDHGMTPTQYELNVNQYIPQHFKNNYMLVASGGTLMVYRKKGPLTGNPGAQDIEFSSLVQALKNAKDPLNKSKLIFSKVVIKGSEDAEKLGLQGDKMPLVVAFSAPGIGLKTSVELSEILSIRSDFPISHEAKEKLKLNKILAGDSEPVPAGNHGHFNGDESMKTALLAFGPELDKVLARDVSNNIALVPVVAQAMKWPAPKYCSGAK